MKISKHIGFRVTAHHPRGGNVNGIVLRAHREEGRGEVLTLDTGFSIVPADITSTETVPDSYCSTYCNFGHSMKTGKPIGHECRQIPPAALRLEREGFYGVAHELMQRGSK